MAQYKIYAGLGADSVEVHIRAPMSAILSLTLMRLLMTYLAKNTSHTLVYMAYLTTKTSWKIQKTMD